jgi:hypothetical protein
MNNNPLVQYVPHPHNENRLVACFVALIHPDDGEIHIGWAQCRANEHFNMRRGREIATGRAMKGTKDTPCPYKFFDIDGSYEWVNTVQQELDLFRFRAMNYFSPKLHTDSDRKVSEVELIFLVVPNYRKDRVAEVDTEVDNLYAEYQPEAETQEDRKAREKREARDWS